MDFENKNKSDRIGETAFAYGEQEKGGYTLKDYYALPEERRVELIDGVFYDMSAPASAHQIAVFEIAIALRSYVKGKKGNCVTLISPVNVQLDCDEDTMVQPDILIVCDRNKILNRCIYGAPDFIVEVFSSSTRWKDATLKLAKYRTAGVREYWMVDLERKKVIVYEFFKQENPVIYGMEEKVSVEIFDGECRIDFAEVYEEVRFLMEETEKGQEYAR